MSQERRPGPGRPHSSSRGTAVERPNANAVPGLDNYLPGGSRRCGRSAVATVRSATTVAGTVIADMLRFPVGPPGSADPIAAGRAIHLTRTRQSTGFAAWDGGHMNRDTLKGQWTQLKGQVRKQWGKLTDDEVDQIQGDTEILMGKLQERYGYSREQPSARSTAGRWNAKSPECCRASRVSVIGHATRSVSWSSRVFRSPRQPACGPKGLHTYPTGFDRAHGRWIDSAELRESPRGTYRFDNSP